MDTEQIINDISKWSKKEMSDVVHKQTNGNSITLSVNNMDFKVDISSNYPQDNTFITLSSDNGLDLIKKLVGHMNLYSENRRPTFYSLLKKISKKYNELKDEVDSTLDISIADTITVNKFDFELMNLEQKLKDLVSKSRSPIASGRKSIPKLYDKSSIGNILTNQYIELIREYRKDPRIDIHIIDENIFTWKVMYKNFKNGALNDALADIKKKYGYGSVELEIDFHDSLFPTHPPVIKVLRPRIDSAMACKIANIRMVQLDYWSPANTIKKLIEKVYKIVDKNIVIDLSNELNKSKGDSFHHLEVLLMNLSSFYKDEGEDDNLDDEVYIKLYDTKEIKKSTATAKTDVEGKYWAKGTGYGHHGQAGWNVNEYIQLQKERDLQVEIILNQIIGQLQSDLDKGNEIAVYETIFNSQLVGFLKSNLDGTTILEMTDRSSFYTTLITIIQNFGTSDGMFLFDHTRNSSDKKLIKLIEHLYNEASTIKKYDSHVDEEALSLDTGNNDITNMIMTIYEWIYPCYAEYESIKKFNEEKEEKEEKEQIDNIENQKVIEMTQDKKYVTTLEGMIFGEAKIMGNNFNYKSDGTGLTKKARRKIASEFATMHSTLEVNPSSSIFYRVDTSNMLVGRVLMTGPKDTPYENGCHIFDMLLPPNYPDTYPKMLFRNNGGVRFNPNLYNSGKVCLSLLGTWHTELSQGGEAWNKDISTMSQLFKSIQSLILIDDPYFNEPSYERTIGTPQGDASTAHYNHSIRYYNMCHTIRDTLENYKKYNGFEDIIFKHFEMKQDDIIKRCEKWTNEATININKYPNIKRPSVESYQKVTNDIKTLFTKMYN